MGRSKQLTFTLACAVVLSALVPGVAGYLSARLEAIESAERNLRALEARLDARQARDIRPIAFPAPCGRPGRRPDWLPELLEALKVQGRPAVAERPDHG
ncbi:hypothetical protein [Nonomuraea sp. SBT364]|uniref:hypothetical protein n=1 Tax=Nonomuraea sp. SBT364 TaxID=1580530 RepID=UPI00066E4071|nr:hypothetical protein [Nonomuraea sp. SBT364]